MRTLRDCVLDLLSVPNLSLLSDHILNDWKKNCLHGLGEHILKPDLTAMVAKQKQVLSLILSHAPEINRLSTLALWRRDDLNPFLALKELNTCPVEKIKLVMRLASIISAAEGERDPSTKPSAIFSRQCGRLQDVDDVRSAVLVDMLSPYSRLMPLSASPVSYATSRNSLNYDDVLGRLCSAPVSEVESLRNFIFQDFSRLSGRRFGDGSRAMAETIPFLITSCHAMGERQRLGWATNLLDQHRELHAMGLFGDEWCVRDQLRMAELSRTLPTREREAVRERLPRFTLLPNFDPQKFLDVLGTLPLAEKGHVLDLALRSPTESAKTFLDHLEMIAATPVEGRDQHARALHESVVQRHAVHDAPAWQENAVQDAPARQSVPVVPPVAASLATVMARGQFENVADATWNRRIAASLERLSLLHGDTQDTNRTVKEIIKHLKSLDGSRSDGVLGRVRANRTEIKNALFAMNGPKRRNDYSEALVQSDPIKKILATVWQAINRYDFSQVSSLEQRKGLSKAQMRQQTELDKTNMRHNLVMSIAACIEDDGHRVCAVGQRSRFVRVLQGYYSQVAIDREADLTPNVLFGELAQQFNHAHGDNPSPAEVEEFVKSAQEAARRTLPIGPAVDEFNRQMRDYLQLQGYE